MNMNKYITQQYKCISWEYKYCESWNILHYLVKNTYPLMNVDYKYVAKHTWRSMERLCANEWNNTSVEPWTPLKQRDVYRVADGGKEGEGRVGGRESVSGQRSMKMKKDQNFGGWVILVMLNQRNQLVPATLYLHHLPPFISTWGWDPGTITQG